MTFFDQQTTVLPPRRSPAASEARRPGTGGLIALLAITLLALTGAAIATAEAIFRADAQRAITDVVRSSLSLSESQRVDVDIDGPVLLQYLIGRYDRVEITAHSVAVGSGNADVTLTGEDLRLDEGTMTADRITGAVTLSAAQASALFLPAEARSVMTVGFSGSELTLDSSMQIAGNPVTMSIAITPRFENGRLTAGLSSVSVGGKTLAAEDVAAQAGTDAAAIQPAALCLAESFPRFLRMRDVRVGDQRLRLEFEYDLPASDTAAGRELGSCP